MSWPCHRDFDNVYFTGQISKTTQGQCRSKCSNPYYPFSGPELAHNAVMLSSILLPRYIRVKERWMLSPAASTNLTASAFPIGTSTKTILPRQRVNASDNKDAPASVAATHGPTWMALAPGRIITYPSTVPCRRTMRNPCGNSLNNLTSIFPRSVPVSFLSNSTISL